MLQHKQKTMAFYRVRSLKLCHKTVEVSYVDLNVEFSQSKMI